MKILLLDYISLCILNGMMIAIACAEQDAPWWMLPVAMEVMTLSWWRTMKELNEEGRRP